MKTIDMLNNKSIKWYALWAMVAINVVLLAIAIANDGVWYMLASLLWSLIILRYHARITRIKELKMLKMNKRRNTLKLRSGMPNERRPRAEVQS
ncbi:hypothetical protein ACXZ1K_09030 [Pedobacter sp. PWIIR3]